MHQPTLRNPRTSPRPFPRTFPRTFPLNPHWIMGLALAGSLALTSGVSAVQILVPSQQPTIQAGIDAAGPGDEVVVATGTYNENINLNGKAITLRSTQPANPAVAHATIIRGNGSQSTILCTTNEPAQTVIDGLMIRNQPPGPSQGGGLRIGSGSGPTIRNCVFFGLTALSSVGAAGGGAVQVIGSLTSGIHPTFTNCLFASCSATNGGAVRLDLSSAVFNDCVFRNNQALLALSPRGGAMYTFGLSPPTLVNCLFEGNFVNSQEAANAGAAIAHFSTRAITIVDCVFRGNRSLSPSGAAVTINPIATQTSTISNTLFCENLPEHIDGPYQDLGGTVLSDTACPPTTGACCVNGVAIELTQAQCSAYGGRFLGLGEPTATAKCAPACPADLNGSGVVNGLDLAVLLGAWGPCPNK